MSNRLFQDLRNLSSTPCRAGHSCKECVPDILSGVSQMTALTEQATVLVDTAPFGEGETVDTRERVGLAGSDCGCTCACTCGEVKINVGASDHTTGSSLAPLPPP